MAADTDVEQLKFLLELSKHQGYAFSPTIDGGHIVVMQRTTMQNMLDKHLDQEQFVILIKGSKTTPERKGD